MRGCVCVGGGGGVRRGGGGNGSSPKRKRNVSLSWIKPKLDGRYKSGKEIQNC